MNKLAVFLHLYYLDQTDELLLCINHLKEAKIPFDLYVSVSKSARFDNKPIPVIPKIKKLYPNAEIYETPNFGYDIGPFIDFLHKIDFKTYEYVLKLHTKRKEKISYACLNKKRYDTALWRKILLNELIGSKEIVLNNWQILINNKKIGMLAPEPLIIAEKNFKEEISKSAAKLGIKTVEPYLFVAGTMFFAKTNLLSPLLNYRISDFKQTESAIHDKTLAHILERMFGVLITAHDHQIKGVLYKNYRFENIKAAIRRFFIQKRHTSKGTMIVKILNIPVYIKKKLPALKEDREQ